MSILIPSNRHIHYNVFLPVKCIRRTLLDRPWWSGYVCKWRACDAVPFDCAG